MPFATSKTKFGAFAVRVIRSNFKKDATAKLDQIVTKLQGYSPKKAVNTVIIDLTKVVTVEPDTMISLLGHVQRFAVKQNLDVRWQFKNNSLPATIFVRLFRNMHHEGY